MRELVSAWVSLGLEYSAGAPDVDAIYIYASSENGSLFANIYFDQGGTVSYPGRLTGIQANAARVSQMQDLLFEDLLRAEDHSLRSASPRRQSTRCTTSRSLASSMFSSHGS